MRTLVGWGLFAVMAPCPVRVLPAQERTTVGGYGEVHYANPTGPKTPPVVNLARFVVYLAHSFDDRLAFRSELEVEDAKLEGGRPGGKIGGSFWYGGTADTNSAVGTGTFGAPVALLSADARYDNGPFAMRVVVATISVSDAEAINATYGQSVGSRIAGGYLAGAYDLLRLFAPASSQKLNAFVRHERYDTQASVP